MKTVCKTNECVGCMACIASCKKNAITLQDNMVSLNALIDIEKCVSCGVCEKVCQINNPIEKRPPLHWYEGWASNEEIRMTSTSGGYATAIMSSFVDAGGVVCSCGYENGQFIFQLATDKEQVRKFAGSKYVKSTPKDAYGLVKNSLKQGKKVLFVGLPCQVAGIYNSLSKELQANLYTIDIICHGTPSVSLFRKFLLDEGIELENIQELKFRCKPGFTDTNEYNTLVPSGSIDAYTYTFLKQVNYTQNCYSCAYSTTDRISDLTLGDSWGSLNVEEKCRGISLALCQTSKGIELLQQASIVLNEADIEKAINANSQLRHAAIIPKIRNEFFERILKGENYNSVARKCFPKVFLKQRIKELLAKLKLISQKESQYRIKYVRKWGVSSKL